MSGAGGSYALVAMLALAAPCAASHPLASAFATREVSAGEDPRLLLAQRVIDREWGPSEDSSYVVVDLPNYKSEGLALVLSGAVPGTGQLYAGEGSGYWFLLAEVAGWTGHYFERRQADRYRSQSQQFAGAPTDTNSNWSFQRWQSATGGDVSTLRALYAVDPDGFYQKLNSDPTYIAGFAGPSGDTFAAFHDLRRHYENSASITRTLGWGLWLNHAIAAFDALRAARNHNLPLGGDVRLKLGTRWTRHGPAVTAALTRGF